MSSSEVNPTPQPPPVQPILKLKLYIAGDRLNSLRALLNVRVICDEHFAGRYQLEVIDVFDNPVRAIADNVLMTPMLVKAEPAPEVRIAGDLSEQYAVVLALKSGWPHDE